MQPLPFVIIAGLFRTSIDAPCTSKAWALEDCSAFCRALLSMYIPPVRGNQRHSTSRSVPKELLISLQASRDALSMGRLSRVGLRAPKMRYTPLAPLRSGA